MKRIAILFLVFAMVLTLCAPALALDRDELPPIIVGCVHNYEAEVFAPTCTEDGFTSYTCKYCGNTYIGDEISGGHQYVDDFCDLCSHYAGDAPELTNGVYEIYTAGHLYWFAQQVNSGNTSINGKLMADITVNTNVLNTDGTLNDDGSNFRTWTPMGNSGSSYMGCFEGNRKTISGLFFNDSAQNYVGLFGFCTNATIQNLIVADSYFSGKYFVGGITGRQSWGTVSNCSNAGSVYGDSDVGGIVGIDWHGAVSNCINTGKVSAGSKNVGGVLGYLHSGGTVNNCVSTGFVSSSKNYVGGIVGNNEGTVTGCYYIFGKVKDGNGTNQFGIGCDTEGSYVRDTSGNTTMKTAAQFASGEVCYLLQQAAPDAGWGQEIGVDSIPVLGGTPVCTPAASYVHSYNLKSDTANGYTTFTCKTCGYSYQEDFRFPDVPHNLWSYNSIEFAVNKGYFSGYQSGKFGPTDLITRQDFVVVLARIAKVDLSQYSGRTGFPDVKAGDYYEKAVKWASSNGIVSGYNNGNFGVGDRITREQMVTILYNYAKKMGYDVSVPADAAAKLNAYTDAHKITGYARPAVIWALYKGVISGMNATTIGPQEYASRGQTATILMNISTKNIMPI